MLPLHDNVPDDAVMFPLPVPPFITVRVTSGVDDLNLAVTVLLAVMVTEHTLALGLSQPVQPSKVEPLEAVAVRVTALLASYCCVAMLSFHNNDPGTTVTSPLPVPSFFTVKVTGASDDLNLAVTVLSVVMVSEHSLALGLSQANQPSKVEPLEAVAVAFNCVFTSYSTVAISPFHDKGPFDEVTAPSPVPSLITVNVTCVCGDVTVLLSLLPALS
ncbi:hypothetical protein MBAV_002121 [Candidatus Magnetobacterium bavaricum]|uniref:Uncharacterized protein n=1 Tax=Candidatus Magnetobacterium bavaricum TaxID=29290 RepID=A0A0F3GUQ1_9BACT|nr:hypothetical protein MBAV_002121 [Candidatus Magnetobacterium bavaricum]